MIQDRESRFIVSHGSGRRDQSLVDEAVAKVHARSGGQPVAWCSDGWRAYPETIRRTYRQPVRTGRPGRPGRPSLVVPEMLSLTQNIFLGLTQLKAAGRAARPDTSSQPRAL